MRRSTIRHANVETFEDLQRDWEESQVLELEMLREQVHFQKSLRDCAVRMDRSRKGGQPPPDKTLMQVELEYVREVMIYCDGRMDEAAIILNIPLRQLRDKYDMARQLAHSAQFRDSRVLTDPVKAETTQT